MPVCSIQNTACLGFQPGNALNSAKAILIPARVLGVWVLSSIPCWVYTAQSKVSLAMSIPINRAAGAVAKVHVAV